MNDELKLELNIALIPEPSLARRLIAVSRDLAKRYPAIVRLGGDGRLAMAPHLTLYQVPLLIKDLAALNEALASIASAANIPRLVSVGLAYNEGEASLEDRKEVTDALVALQNEVVAAANALRGDLLLERDPAGNRVADLLQAPGRLGENIRRTGYAETGDPRNGGLFRPHDTLNWFEPGTRIDAEREQRKLQPAALSGAYAGIGVFALGPYGTCPQLLASHKFAGL